MRHCTPAAAASPATRSSRSTIFIAYDSELPATLRDYSVDLLLPTSDVAAGNWRNNGSVMQTVEVVPPASQVNAASVGNASTSAQVGQTFLANGPVRQTR